MERKRPTSKPVTAQTAQEVVNTIRKEHGNDTAMLLGDNKLSIDIKGVCSTQSLALDKAIGRNGVPYGRLTLLAGPEGGGKTTVALHLCAECQRTNGIVLYIDAEYKLDPGYAQKIGVNIQDMIISQPLHLEQALGIIMSTVKRISAMRKEQKIDIPILVVLDSMTACPAKCEIEGELGDKHYAPQANVMSSGLKHIIRDVSSERVALVFISQLREKIGVMFGNKDDTTCGKAPRFYASLGINIKRKGALANNDKAHVCEGYVWKNQIAVPFKKGEFVIEFGKGIDIIHEIVALGVEAKIIEQSGAWYSFQGERIGQGLENAKEYLKEHKDIADKIRRML